MVNYSSDTRHNVYTLMFDPHYRANNTTKLHPWLTVQKTANGIIDAIIQHFLIDGNVEHAAIHHPAFNRQKSKLDLDYTAESSTSISSTRGSVQKRPSFNTRTDALNNRKRL